jgi:hypothetical protein
MKDTLYKTREYLNYIEAHYHDVQLAWADMQEVCKDMDFLSDNISWGVLDSQVKLHDLSKLSIEEFVPYRRKFFPTEWEEGEKISPDEFEAAWKHHQEHNAHHWQNWTKQEAHKHEWRMNCAHMVIDWIAMGYHFNNTAQIYYETNKINLPDDAVKFIYEIFERVYDPRRT